MGGLQVSWGKEKATLVGLVLWALHSLMALCILNTNPAPEKKKK